MAGKELPTYADLTTWKPLDDSHPFGLPWMDSCYQESLLPDGPWQIIAEVICKKLADRISKHFNYPERRQILFELLGLHFMMKYFPEENNDPLIIKTPHMSDDARRTLKLEAQNWLKSSLKKIIQELNLPDPSEQDPEKHWLNRPGEFDDKTDKLMKKTDTIFRKGLDRHLLLQEREILRRWDELHKPVVDAQEFKLTARDRERELQRIQRERDRLYGGFSTAPTAASTVPPGLRSILKNSGGAQGSVSTRLSTSDSTKTGLSRLKTANVKGALFGSAVDPPVFSGMQSSSLGRSMVAVLRRDPRRIQRVAAGLRGRQLPNGLRQFLWLDVLLKVDRAKHHGLDINVESIVRQTFADGVVKGQRDLKTKRPTHSPIARLIENNVIETFADTPSMYPYRENSELMTDAAKALNILYVYNRTYEAYLVYWVFPLQLAYDQDNPEKDHAYDLSLYLELLIRGLYPKWPQIFAIAEQVMTVISDFDPALYQQLLRISDIKPAVNPKDFLVNLINLERDEAKDPTGVRQYPTQHYADQPENRALLTQPVIFIRKWIGEAFVGVLDTQAVLYVWDQCFIYSWNPDVLRDICIILLLLLRHHFMDAKDFNQMRQVFLNEPCLLYTMDIQQAFRFLRSVVDQQQIPEGKHYLEIPLMNSRRPKERLLPASVPPSPSYSLTPKPSAVTPARPPSTTSTIAPKILDPVGIKRLKVNLEVPQTAVHKVPWLNDLAALSVRLRFAIMFGSITLKSQDFNGTAAITKEQDPQGTLLYKVDYKSSQAIFDDLDIGQLDLEMEMGGYPHIILELLCKPPNQTDQVALGWSRIKLFQRTDSSDEASISQSKWNIMTGDCTYTLYTGPAIDRFSDNKTPKFTTSDSAADIGKSLASLKSIDSTYLGLYGDLIGPKSNITALIFDPLRETPRRATAQPTAQPPPPAEPVGQSSSKARR